MITDVFILSFLPYMLSYHAEILPQHRKTMLRGRCQSTEVKSLFCTGDSWSLPTLLLCMSLPARCAAKSSGFIDFFVSPELSKSSPKPGASWGRGGEQQTLKSDVLQPSQEATMSKGDLLAALLRGHVPADGSTHTSICLPPPLPFPRSFSVGCFKENKIYGSGSKSCFLCLGASRCTLLAGSALPSPRLAPKLLHLTQKMDHVTIHQLPPAPQPPELASVSQKCQVLAAPCPSPL